MLEHENDTPARTDEVIREIDVYLTDDLQLYLAQFPMRPVYQEPPQIKSARLKPKCNKMELCVPYPSGMQRSVDLPPAERMQKFVSSEVRLNQNLAAGFIFENSMIIAPIQSVLQFRPGLIPAGGGGATMPRTEVVEMGPQDNDTLLETEENDTIQQIQLKRKETERTQAARLKSYAYLKQQAELEPWQDLNVYPIGESFVQCFHSLLLNFVMI